MENVHLLGFRIKKKLYACYIIVFTCIHLYYWFFPLINHNFQCFQTFKDHFYFLQKSHLYKYFKPKSMITVSHKIKKNICFFLYLNYKSYSLHIQKMYNFQFFTLITYMELAYFFILTWTLSINWWYTPKRFWRYKQVQFSHS